MERKLVTIAYKNSSYQVLFPQELLELQEHNASIQGSTENSCHSENMNKFSLLLLQSHYTFIFKGTSSVDQVSEDHTEAQNKMHVI